MLSCFVHVILREPHETGDGPLRRLDTCGDVLEPLPRTPVQPEWSRLETKAPVEDRKQGTTVYRRTNGVMLISTASRMR